MRYAILLEPTKTGFSAHVPDLPGCVAAGETREETLDLIRDAIEFHLEGMQLHGEPAPVPACTRMDDGRSVDGIEEAAASTSMCFPG
jgi:predicted RNase H-like HicB family nuclease